jgi:hypothetical protein
MDTAVTRTITGRAGKRRSLSNPNNLWKTDAGSRSRSCYDMGVDKGGYLRLTATLKVGGPMPVLVQAGDKAAAITWDDCFSGKVRNEHTRLAYERHVRHFLSWATHNNRTALAEITAGDVGRLSDPWHRKKIPVQKETSPVRFTQVFQPGQRTKENRRHHRRPSDV